MVGSVQDPRYFPSSLDSARILPRSMVRLPSAFFLFQVQQRGHREEYRLLDRLVVQIDGESYRLKDLERRLASGNNG